MMNNYCDFSFHNAEFCDILVSGDISLSPHLYFLPMFYKLQLSSAISAAKQFHNVYMCFGTILKRTVMF